MPSNMNGETGEFLALMCDIEHASPPDIELLDTGRYPVLVGGVVRVETIEEAKELLEDVA